MSYMLCTYIGDKKYAHQNEYPESESESSSHHTTQDSIEKIPAQSTDNASDMSSD